VFSEHLSGTVALGYIHAKYDTFSRFVPAGAPNPVNPSQTIPAGGQMSTWPTSTASRTPRNGRATPA
jgi:hypothetical protein